MSKYKRVANFFLNKDKEATGNRPTWRGDITLDKPVQAGEKILISGWDKEGNISCAVSIKED
tara:strand:- start:1057 stop:1242 length:186 start_codon:yes stop_codon:yes gene_type:complete